MIGEDWDEGYDPPESATYAGGDSGNSPAYFDSEPSVRAQAGLTPPAESNLLSAFLDIRELLWKHHKMHHDDFITELAGIVNSTPLPTSPSGALGDSNGGVKS